VSELRAHLSVFLRRSRVMGGNGGSPRLVSDDLTFQGVKGGSMEGTVRSGTLNVERPSDESLFVFAFFLGGRDIHFMRVCT
jgi:hypothetical protein